MADKPSFAGDKRKGPGALLLLCFFAGTAVVAVLLFGERLMLFNLGLSAVFTGFLWACAILIDSSRSTGFSLNDESRCIITAKGETIPYSAVRAVTIARAADGVCAYVVVGGLGLKKHIFYSRDPSCGDYLKEQLRARFESLRVKHATLRLATLDFLPLAVVPLTAVILAGMSGYFYWSYPSLSVFPQELVLTYGGQADPVHQKRFRLGRIFFSLPDTFLPVQKGQGTLLLQSYSTGATLLADTTRMIVRQNKAPLLVPVLYAAGLQSDYAFIEMAYCSRLGLVPLVFKAALLSMIEPETLHIYRVRRGPWTGFVTQGLCDSAGSRLCKTDIVLTHDQGSGHMYMSLRTSGRCPDKSRVADIVYGINTAGSKSDTPEDML